MLAMIPNDFKVALVYQDGESSLFTARRPDVWHFVLATTKKVAPNHQTIDIGQFHLPRYSVARALASSSATLIPELVQQLGIRVSGDKLSMTFRGTQYQLPDGLLAEMRKDIPILEKAAAKVKPGRAGFEVIDATSSRHFPVVTEQRSLADAIAFERETRKTLNPRDFAVYSAYCTWRDFIRDDPEKKRSIATGIAEETMILDPLDLIDDETYWASVFEIQERLWGERIWGPGVDTKRDVLFDAFFRGFERLSSIQFAQFVLMNGMHRGGPFHAFATTFGLIDFEGYKYWRTFGLQPDSPAEQLIRIHSSFIQLLGLKD